MHSVVPIRNSRISDERRRHVRQKLTSIVYVELGPGNGGILINLGTGGLALQAVAKLNLETELALRFRLHSVEQAIETRGCVTWLGPTQKEAGVSFKNLPSNMEQEIAEWIAGQEQTWSTQAETAPKLPPTRTGAPRLPIQPPVPVSFPPEKPESVRPSSAPGISPPPLSESSQRQGSISASDAGTLTVPPAPMIPFRIRPEESIEGISRLSTSQFAQGDVSSNAPDAVPPPAPPALALPFRTRSEERFELALDKTVDSPSEHCELLLEPEKLSPGAEQILPRDSVLPSLISPAKGVVSADRRAPAVRDSIAAGSRRRHKIGIAAAACAVGVLVLIVTVTNLSKPVDPSGSAAQPVISPPAVITPESTTQTQPAAHTGHGIEDAPSAAAPIGANLPTPVYTTHQPATVPEDGKVLAFMEALLGMDVPTKVNPAVLSLPVWTVQHSGFYYCAYSPDFQTLQPGIIMTQGEALQSGYQPKLGSYCQ